MPSNGQQRSGQIGFTEFLPIASEMPCKVKKGKKKQNYNSIISQIHIMFINLAPESTDVYLRKKLKIT